MKKRSYPILYTLWASMFLLTAALGLLFPQETGLSRWVLTAVSLIFFVPPWMILSRARAQQEHSQIRLVRYLSLASVVLTAVLWLAAPTLLRFFGAGAGAASASSASASASSASAAPAAAATRATSS